jgi:hypothetical protein
VWARRQPIAFRFLTGASGPGRDAACTSPGRARPSGSFGYRCPIALAALIIARASRTASSARHAIRLCAATVAAERVRHFDGRWAVINPLGLFITGPVLDAFGTTPVLIAFAAVQTVSMSVISVASARELGRQRLELAAA